MISMRSVTIQEDSEVDIIRPMQKTTRNGMTSMIVQ